MSDREISGADALAMKARYLESLKDIHLLAAKYTLREWDHFAKLSQREQELTVKRIVEELHQMRRESLGLSRLRSAAEQQPTTIEPGRLGEVLKNPKIFSDNQELFQFASSFIEEPIATPVNESRKALVRKLLRAYERLPKHKQALFVQGIVQRARTLNQKGIDTGDKFRKYFEAWERQIKGQ